MPRLGPGQEVGNDNHGGQRNHTHCLEPGAGGDGVGDGDGDTTATLVSSAAANGTSVSRRTLRDSVMGKWPSSGTPHPPTSWLRAGRDYTGVSG
jgi:hypothetical protein